MTRSPERTALIVENVTWARGIAYNLARQRGLLAVVDEMVSDAYVGLVLAADAFDERHGLPFRVYASYLIRGGILNGLRARDQVSDRVRQIIREGKRFIDEVRASAGVTPSYAEIEAEVPGFERARARVRFCSPVSLDAPLRLPAMRESSVEAVLVDAETRAELAAALAALPARDADVAEAYYFGDEPLYTIAARLRISPQRASQIHTRAVQRLRATMGGAA